MDSFLGRPRRKKFRVGFVVGQMEMGICFANATFLLHAACQGTSRVSFAPCPWIVAVGPVVFSGMAGCLVLVYMVRGTPGPPPLVGWLAVLWSAVLVLILLTILVSGPRLISGMWMILLWK